MQKIIKVLCVVLAIVGITGCGAAYQAVQNTTQNSVTAVETTTTQKTVFPMTIKDSYDREVKIEKEPKRIVSLAPNITEAIFALESGDRLAGRTDYCDYPSEASKITSVGSLKTPSIEKIAELKPDLVIASTHFSKETLKKLEELNIPTAVLYGEESFDGVYDTISKVGKVLNVDKKAEALVSGMKKKVDDVKKKLEGKNRPSVYYVIGYGKSGDYTAGKDTFIGQLIETAGAKNVADDVKGWKYSLEKLIEKNPDIIICPSDGGFKQGLQSTNGYKDLTAVKNGKLYEIDQNILNRQGPRLADGLIKLAEIIHSEDMR